MKTPTQATRRWPQLMIPLLSTGLGASLGIGLWGCASNSPEGSRGPAKTITRTPQSDIVLASAQNQDSASSTGTHPLVLAVKYVAYTGSNGQPVLNKDTASHVIEGMNSIYGLCAMSFTLEDFQSPVPETLGLEFFPSSMRELDPIRSEFDDPKQLVVIGTGPWDSSGGLGADGANAWTRMPGESPSGAVIEASAADHVPLVAHELGHYLDLDHVNDTENLMNPVIYAESTTLEPWQCETLREAALSIRSEALRDS